MLLRHSAAGLAELVRSGSVAEALLEQMLIRHGQRPSPGEVRSWQRSLPLLAQDLVQAGLADVEVLVEYVYTAQGFEYDWSGVIIGPDLVWRDDHWVAVRSANRDPAFRNMAKVSDEQFDRLVRNVYKVLLTRGMIGTVIYSADPETRAMLRSLAGLPKTSAGQW